MKGQQSDFSAFGFDDFVVDDDQIEALKARPALLDNKGVTSHTGDVSVEKLRYFAGMRVSEALLQAGCFKESEALGSCHSWKTFKRCNGCRKSSSFWNRCDRMLCPQCAPFLAKKRLDGLMWFFDRMQNPKHVVLTFKNVPELTREYVSDCLQKLQKLRRQKIAKSWKAGIWAMEITNKGKGWHLHYHLVIESRWFSQRELQIAWKFLTHEDSFIVHVSDASRDGTMKKLPRYVASYTTKGTCVSEWEPHMLRQFVDSMDGKRAFGVFGELYAKRTEWREWIKSLRVAKRMCECGCSEATYYTEIDWIIATDLTPDSCRSIAPPSASQLQIPHAFAGLLHQLALRQ